MASLYKPNTTGTVSDLLNSLELFTICPICTHQSLIYGIDNMANSMYCLQVDSSKASYGAKKHHQVHDIHKWLLGLPEPATPLPTEWGEIAP